MNGCALKPDAKNPANGRVFHELDCVADLTARR